MSKKNFKCDKMQSNNEANKAKIYTIGYSNVKFENFFKPIEWI